MSPQILQICHITTPQMSRVNREGATGVNSATCCSCKCSFCNISCLRSQQSTACPQRTCCNTIWTFICWSYDRATSVVRTTGESLHGQFATARERWLTCPSSPRRPWPDRHLVLEKSSVGYHVYSKNSGLLEGAASQITFLASIMQMVGNGYEVGLASAL